MTVISQIITEAYRESNNIPIGQLPTAMEQAEGLLVFNRLLKSVYGNEAGDPLLPINIGNNNVVQATYYDYVSVPSSTWYPPSNSRLVFNNISSQTVNLNPYPNDGERLAIVDASNNFATIPVILNGNGKTIDGQTSVTLNTNGLKKEYFFRADTNDWTTISDLQLTDTFPFPEEFEDLFIIGLAIRINPRNKQQIDPQSIQAYNRLRSLFKARYGQTVEQRTETGLLRTLGVRYQVYRNYAGGVNSAQRFNSGNSY